MLHTLIVLLIIGNTSLKLLAEPVPLLGLDLNLGYSIGSYDVNQKSLSGDPFQEDNIQQTSHSSAKGFNFNGGIKPSLVIPRLFKSQRNEPDPNQSQQQQGLQERSAKGKTKRELEINKETRFRRSPQSQDNVTDHSQNSKDPLSGHDLNMGYNVGRHENSKNLSSGQSPQISNRALKINAGAKNSYDLAIEHTNDLPSQYNTAGNKLDPNQSRQKQGLEEKITKDRKVWKPVIARVIRYRRSPQSHENITDHSQNSKDPLSGHDLNLGYNVGRHENSKNSSSGQSPQTSNLDLKINAGDKNTFDIGIEHTNDLPSQFNSTGNELDPNQSRQKQGLEGKKTKDKKKRKSVIKRETLFRLGPQSHENVTDNSQNSKDPLSGHDLNLGYNVGRHENSKNSSSGQSPLISNRALKINAGAKNSYDLAIEHTNDLPNRCNSKQGSKGKKSKDKKKKSVIKRETRFRRSPQSQENDPFLGHDLNLGYNVGRHENSKDSRSGQSPQISHRSLLDSGLGQALALRSLFKATGNEQEPNQSQPQESFPLVLIKTSEGSFPNAYK